MRGVCAALESGCSVVYVSCEKVTLMQRLLLWRSADCYISTSLRDGLRLFPLEFLAAKLFSCRYTYYAVVYCTEKKRKEKKRKETRREFEVSL